MNRQNSCSRKEGNAFWRRHSKFAGAHRTRKVARRLLSVCSVHFVAEATNLRKCSVHFRRFDDFCQCGISTRLCSFHVPSQLQDNTIFPLCLGISAQTFKRFHSCFDISSSGEFPTDMLSKQTNISPQSLRKQSPTGFAETIAQNLPQHLQCKVRRTAQTTASRMSGVRKSKKFWDLEASCSDYLWNRPLRVHSVPVVSSGQR